MKTIRLSPNQLPKADDDSAQSVEIEASSINDGAFMFTVGDRDNDIASLHLTAQEVRELIDALSQALASGEEA